MVNSWHGIAFKLLLFACLTCPAHSQTDADRERRLAELERKIRILEPSFASTGTFDDRLAIAERKIDELLNREKRVEVAAAPAPARCAATAGFHLRRLPEFR